MVTRQRNEPPAKRTKIMNQLMTTKVIYRSDSVVSGPAYPSKEFATRVAVGRLEKWLAESDKQHACMPFRIKEAQQALAGTPVTSSRVAIVSRGHWGEGAQATLPARQVVNFASLADAVKNLRDGGYRVLVTVRAETITVTNRTYPDRGADVPTSDWHVHRRNPTAGIVRSGPNVRRTPWWRSQ